MDNQPESFMGVIMEWPECPVCNGKDISGLLPVTWEKTQRDWKLRSLPIFQCNVCEIQLIGEESLIWTQEIYHADTGALMHRKRGHGETRPGDLGFHGEAGK